jgi:hypothetical protein
MDPTRLGQEIVQVIWKCLPLEPILSLWLQPRQILHRTDPRAHVEQCSTTELAADLPLTPNALQIRAIADSCLRTFR